MSNPSTSDSSECNDNLIKINISIDEEEYKQILENENFLKTALTVCDKWDKKVSNYIYNIEVNDWIEKIIYIFARIFNSDLIIIFYILLFLYQSFVNKNYFFVVKPLVHVFIVFLLTGILKFSFKRPRPEINENVKRRYNVRKKENNFSLPSGDSMQAANFAIIFLFYSGSYIGFIILPFVMFARIFYFCHYLLDTVIGAIIGLSVSFYITFPLKSLHL